MDYSIDRIGDGNRVACRGRLSFADASAFHDIAERIRSDPGSAWFLDFSGLEFIDSAGLGMLLMVRDLVDRGNGRITIRGAGGQVRKALDLARFGELMAIEA